MVELVIIAIIIILSVKKPNIALAILMNIYVIRAIPEINWYSPCFSGDCALLDSSVVFGLILPLLSMTIIVLRIFFLKSGSIIFPNDFIDKLLVSLTLILYIYLLFSPDIEFSLDYFLRYIFIGISFYYVLKLYLVNNNNATEAIREIFLAFYFLGILVSLLAYYILFINNLTIVRLTLPGIHPIPFAQLIGMSFIVAFAIFFTDGKILEIRNKGFLYFNNIIFVYMLITLFATNTRGILFSAVIVSLLFFILNPIKVSRLKVGILFLVLVFIIIYIVSIIDTSFLFQRLINTASDQSVSDRLIAYRDTIEILSENLLGVGTGAFGYYSSLGYPHNLFLQNIAEYGMFGLIWNVFFIYFIVYALFFILKIKRKAALSVLLYLFFIYYFIESMFSFTLWMQKGMFFGLGLMSYLFYYIKTFRPKNDN